MLRGKLANQVDKHDLSSHCKMKACEIRQTTGWPQNKFTNKKRKKKDIWPNKIEATMRYSSKILREHRARTLSCRCLHQSVMT